MGMPHIRTHAGTRPSGRRGPGAGSGVHSSCSCSALGTHCCCERGQDEPRNADDTHGIADCTRSAPTPTRGAPTQPPHPARAHAHVGAPLALAHPPSLRYINNRNTYLAQAQSHLRRIERLAVQAQARAQPQADALRAFNKALQIMQTSSKVEQQWRKAFRGGGGGGSAAGGSGGGGVMACRVQGRLTAAAARTPGRRLPPSGRGGASAGGLSGALAVAAAIMRAATQGGDGGEAGLAVAVAVAGREEGLPALA